VFTGQRGPLTRNGIWRVVKDLMAAVGLDPRYATHSCRRTYATYLYRASGADPEVVQEQLGHASIKTTTIYARVTKEDKLRAANALTKAFAGTGGRKERSRTGVSSAPVPLPWRGGDSIVPIVASLA
jgi:integrase